MFLSSVSPTSSSSTSASLRAAEALAVAVLVAVFLAHARALRSGGGGGGWWWWRACCRSRATTNDDDDEGIYPGIHPGPPAAARCSGRRRVRSVPLWRPPQIVDGFAGCVGNTPLVYLRTLSEATGCTILAKAEFLNPGGSSKDRIARAIVRQAQQRGKLPATTGGELYQ